MDDTIHVIYQVLKGGDSHIRVFITDPVGNITFIKADSQFGWYDEERSKVPGKKSRSKSVYNSFQKYIIFLRHLSNVF